MLTGGNEIDVQMDESQQYYTNVTANNCHWEDLEWYFQMLHSKNDISFAKKTGKDKKISDCVILTMQNIRRMSEIEHTLSKLEDEQLLQKDKILHYFLMSDDFKDVIMLRKSSTSRSAFVYSSKIQISEVLPTWDEMFQNSTHKVHLWTFYSFKKKEFVTWCRKISKMNEGEFQNELQEKYITVIQAKSEESTRNIFY